MQEQTTRFYLIRHGQTEWNTVDRLRGRSDIALNEVGLAQVDAAGRVLANKPLKAIYTSPLLRARQTAAAIAKYHQLEPIVNEAFHDFDFGIWSGQERAKIRSQWAAEFRLYREQPTYFRAPEGESFWDVYQRVLFGMQELNQRHPGAEIAIATHNVTAVITMLAVLGLPLSSYWSFDPANASITTFTRSLNGRFFLESYNDTHHLAS